MRVMSLEEENTKYENRLKRALISDVSGEEDAIRKIQVMINQGLLNVCILLSN